MRAAVFTLTMLTGLNFAVAQDVIEVGETSTEETNEEQVAEPEAVEVAEPEAIEVAEPEAVEVAEPEAIEVAEPEAVEVAEPEAAEVVVERQAWGEPPERVPYHGRRLTGPLMGVRSRLHQRDLNRVLKENSLGLPLGLLLGGAAGAVGFTLFALAVCNAEDDPMTGESSCTRPAAAGLFAVLGYAGYLVTLAGVVTLLVRVITRRVAYRRYRSRSGLSLTGSGLELRF